MACKNGYEHYGWQPNMKKPKNGPSAPAAPQKRPTQRDIAQATGLSQTSVSLVLNGVEPSTVSAEARERIQEAARRLGYVPNRMARNLQSARTRTLACIVPDITNPTYPALIRGFQSAADAAGYDTMIFDTDGTLERERRALQWLSQGHVDGVLALFFRIDEAELVKAGCRSAAAGMSSKPATATSSGMRRPAARSAVMAPIASRSLAANTASHGKSPASSAAIARAPAA